MKNYCALIADIKNSRGYNAEDRGITQKKLYLIIDFLNVLFKSKLERGFYFSSGDAIQCLFKDKTSGLECAYLLRTLFYPNEIRIGVGIGSINNYIFHDELFKKYHDSNPLDGEAFHKAINAVSNAKMVGNSILVFSEKPEDDIVINHLLNTSQRMRNKLSDQRKRLLFIYDVISPLLSQRELELYSNNIISFFERILQLNDYKYSHFSNDHDFLDFLDYNFLAQAFSRDRIMRIIELRNNMKWSHILESEINNPKDDELISYFMKVSYQNISQLRINGNLNEIRKNELLALFLLTKRKEDFFNND